MQFRDDGLYPAAAHADAGADRVDAAVIRMNRNFSAASGVARDGIDLDYPVVDLRHFLAEQFGHELRVGARQEDLRAARFRADIVDVGADPFVAAEMFAGQEFVAPQDALGAAKIHRDIAELDPLDQAVDDLADAILVLFILPLALRFPHTLDDDLFCRLRGDAAEIDRRQGIDEELAECGVDFTLMGLIDGQLRRFVLDLFNHFQIPR